MRLVPPDSARMLLCLNVQLFGRSREEELCELIRLRQLVGQLFTSIIAEFGLKNREVFKDSVLVLERAAERALHF